MEQEHILSLEICDDGVVLFGDKKCYGTYSMTLFLCEIYEKLRNRFEYGIDEDEFFNYQDPQGAWQLLKDYFEKTDYLRNATLKDFEEYRSRYGISLEFKKGIIVEEKDLNRTPIEIAAFMRFSKELDPWRKFDKDSVDNSLFDPDVFRYYSCRTMIDFVFSLVHYCVFNGYKIAECSHCGHLFARTTDKEKYCTRGSPFPGYESYNCKKAVKAIKDMLEAKRRSEYERLRKKAVEYGVSSKHNAVYNDFCSVCGDYKKQLRQGASVELLQRYMSYLFDSENVRPKYQRIKNW